MSDSVINQEYAVANALNFLVFLSVLGFSPYSRYLESPVVKLINPATINVIIITLSIPFQNTKRATATIRSITPNPNLSHFTIFIFLSPFHISS